MVRNSVEIADGRTIWSWKEKQYLVSSKPGSIAKFAFITTSPSFPPPPRLPDQRPIRIERPNRSKNSRPGGKQHRERALADQRASRGGSVAIAYQRSKFYGLGQVSCWVDDDMRGTRTVDGYWDIEERNMGV